MFDTLRDRVGQDLPCGPTAGDEATVELVTHGEVSGQVHPKGAQHDTPG
jgi:hypothetical protein